MANFNVDTNGNLWIGTNVSDTFSTAQGQSATNFYVTSAGSIYAVDGTIGGLTLDSSGISANYSASNETGFKIFSSDGSAEFNDVTVRGTLDGPSLTGTLTGGTSGSIRVGDTGDEVRIIEDSAAGGFIAYYNGGYNVATMSYDGSSLFEINTGQNSSSTFADLGINSGGGDLYLLADNIRLKDNPMGIGSGSNAPVLWLWNGSAYERGQNNVLGTDSNGNLEWTTVASSPVTSISGSGDITVTSSSGAYTIDHDDSDHSFASTSSVTANTNSITNVSSSLTSHSSNSTAHGTFDNYNYWRLREDGNNVGVVSSTESVNFIGGSGITVSNSGSGGDYNITISSSGTAHTHTSVLSIGVLDLNLYRDIVPQSSNSKRVGTSSTNRMLDVFSRDFHGGTFYGTLVNSSSQNTKTNIEDTGLGLDFIEALPVKQFNYITADHSDKKYTGVIAEDVTTILEANGWDDYYLVVDDSEKYSYNTRCSHPVKCDDSESFYCEDDCCSSHFKYTEEDGSVSNWLHHTVEECEEYEVDGSRHPHFNYYQLIGPLVKSVQELSTQISDLTARVEALEG
jgi:hypothetical protein